MIPLTNQNSNETEYANPAAISRVELTPKPSGDHALICYARGHTIPVADYAAIAAVLGDGFKALTLADGPAVSVNVAHVVTIRSGGPGRCTLLMSNGGTFDVAGTTTDVVAAFEA